MQKCIHKGIFLKNKLINEFTNVTEWVTPIRFMPGVIGCAGLKDQYRDLFAQKVRITGGNYKLTRAYEMRSRQEILSFHLMEFVFEEHVQVPSVNKVKRGVCNTRELENIFSDGNGSIRTFSKADSDVLLLRPKHGWIDLIG